MEILLKIYKKFKYIGKHCFSLDSQNLCKKLIINSFGPERVKFCYSY